MVKRHKKKLSFAFKELRKNLDMEINALHPINDNKHEKFLKMFGFKRKCYYSNYEGQDYDLYVRR